MPAFDFGFDDSFDVATAHAIDAAVVGERGVARYLDAACRGRRNAGLWEGHAVVSGARSTHYGLNAVCRGSRGVAYYIDGVCSGKRNCRMLSIAAACTGARGVARSINAHVFGKRNVETLYESEVRVYAAVDESPDTDALILAGTAPLATILDSATLPTPISLASILQSGTHTYYLDFRRFNKRGDRRGGYSQTNIERHRLDLTAGTLTELAFPPSLPLWIQAAPYGDHQVRIQAAYNYLLDGTNQADTWWVWVQPTPPFIVPADFTYTMTKRGGFAMLDIVPADTFVDPFVSVGVGVYSSDTELWSGEEVTPGYLAVFDLEMTSSGPTSPTHRSAIPADGVM